jgi:hypothetical protein
MTAPDFDAAAAWRGLTAAQQESIGQVALDFAVHCLAEDVEDLDDDTLPEAIERLHERLLDLVAAALPPTLLGAANDREERP